MQAKVNGEIKMQVKCIVCKKEPERKIINKSLQMQKINLSDFDFVLCQECFDVKMKEVKNAS